MWKGQENSHNGFERRVLNAVTPVGRGGRGKRLLAIPSVPVLGAVGSPGSYMKMDSRTSIPKDRHCYFCGMRGHELWRCHNKQAWFQQKGQSIERQWSLPSPPVKPNNRQGTLPPPPPLRPDNLRSKVRNWGPYVGCRLPCIITNTCQRSRWQAWRAGSTY